MVHKSLETSSAPPRPPASSKVGDDGAFEGDEELADLGIDSRRVARRRLRAGHEVQGLREMARKKKEIDTRVEQVGTTRIRTSLSIVMVTMNCG